MHYNSSHCSVDENVVLWKPNLVDVKFDHRKRVIEMNISV